MLVRAVRDRSTLTLYFRLNVECEVEWIYNVMCVVNGNSSFSWTESFKKNELAEVIKKRIGSEDD